MAKKTSANPAVKCDLHGCNRDAIGGFHETEDVASFTETGALAISETHWCAEHEQAMSQHLHGKTGNWVVF